MPSSASSSQVRLPYTLRLPPRARIVCLGHELKETLGVRLARRALVLGSEVAGCTVAGSYCLSDGGDGFLQAYSDIYPARRHKILCHAPLGTPVYSELLYDDASKTATIEMALCSGLALVPPDRRDIMNSGTAGLGELISRAVLMGAERLHVGIGGSATCDGGLGMLMRMQQILFRDRTEKPYYLARDLARPPRVQISQLRDALKHVDIRVFCDVGNVLTGPNGTARTYARQKGASDDQIAILDTNLERWAAKIEEEVKLRLRNVPGAGAAGGVGFSLAALGGRLDSGASAFCDLIHLRELLETCDGLITCEGRFDATSFDGKAPYRAAQIAVESGKRAMIACGSADPLAAEQAEALGIRIIPFGQDLTPEQRSAMTMSRLQAAVAAYVRGVI